ncbi:MAG: M23 family metallopeptidase [Mediterranea massiliensis]|nr:M23 family metallopeptidase [Mediterranea massiliensis]
MLRSLLITLLLLVGTASYAQQPAKDAHFELPFDFPIYFSGNFGELRSNHFHGGLDFKTQGVSGKPVRAVADGYISRIRVNHGSGYVLDVVHDNGYTTINRHLSAFVGEIAQLVEDKQYETESWEVEIVPEKNRYRVKAGEVIALSGNTGYSYGPHLHMDLFETITDDYIDPLPFFVDRVVDTVAPKALGMMLFPQRGRGVVNGLDTPVQMPLNGKKEFTAWGEIGVAIRAYDYMNGVSNRYGVKRVVLEVDGVETFRSEVDRYRYDENLYINSWTHGQYMKSFIEPGNKLGMLHAKNGNRGLITINEERPYRFVYTLTDAFGNSSKVRFTVNGKRSEISPRPHREKHIFRWNKVNVLHEPGIELIVPRGLLYDDAYLNYAMRADSNDVAFTYQLNNTAIPMHDYCNISIGLRHMPVADSTKYYVASVAANGKTGYVGGYYYRGKMHARIRQLATYTVKTDTIPPQITPVSPKLWTRNGRVVLKVKDEGSGMKTYRATINGEYILLGKPNAVNGNLVYEIDKKRITPAGKHLLEVTVKDMCGNVATYRHELKL